MTQKRLLDIALALVLLLMITPVAIVVAVAVRLTSTGPAIYWSQRVGQHGALFAMPKFRTMKVETPAMATHLLVDAKAALTPIGGFLRASSLDEIPQLWSVLIGDMSFVGPRPALFNQDDLVALRKSLGVDGLRPGITGWAQINGRDSLSIPDKVSLDAEYLRRQTAMFDLWIMALTAVRVLAKDNVRH